MKIVYFTHSLRSCWNHGNAHFLRGVLRELVHAGHEVAIFEPEGAWSLANLLKDHGRAALEPFANAYPELSSRIYSPDFDLDEALQGADLVVAHEWNDPRLIAEIGQRRIRAGRFVLLFHDTHHRAVSDPRAIATFDLSGYDGVLAFGAALADIYRRAGWGKRAFVWHEAADARLFRPPPRERDRIGLVWIGNWGDEERADELERFLLKPAHAAGLPLDIHGVRYPESALAMLAHYRARYRGWLANARVPEIFALHLATAHVPRRYYSSALPGIPTIRVFEALACGVPLTSAPWEDSENLFSPGRDYLLARDETEMTRHLLALKNDVDLRASLAEHGLATIRARHTCAHRARELLVIVARLSSSASEAAA
jgi:spore maturation protein CgeB